MRYLVAIATPTRLPMPETTFEIDTLLSQSDADAVMFELQDLPCVNQADVDLPRRRAWVSHTAMISPQDIADALQEAGYASRVVEGGD
ncbi:MAG: heavy-metal-associated domain-containing protein [Burkholderiaceae bacterium]|nr:heavy-metal-associated domain-containing protein [Burkholderiaceae bacterium]